MYLLSSKGPGPFFIAGTVVLVDQLTKAIAAAKLVSADSVPLLGNIISLTLVNNTGAAFGLFRYQTPVFIAISIFAIAFMAFYLVKKKVVYYLPLALILGGAVGNLIDRLRFGHVVDFIDLHFWPVFNVADSCITIGSVLLFIIILKEKDAPRTV